MKCRPGCGACCIAMSISSSIPGMPQGKPGGIRCPNLSETNVCYIHGMSNYPSVCKNLKPSKEMCGNSYIEAFTYMSVLERETKPNSTSLNVIPDYDEKKLV